MSATRKVTGHFHLDLHINLLPSYAVNNTGGSEGTAIKLEEKCILCCPNTVPGLVRSVPYIYN